MRELMVVSTLKLIEPLGIITSYDIVRTEPPDQFVASFQSPTLPAIQVTVLPKLFKGDVKEMSVK